jgi:hypothetical protein
VGGAIGVLIVFGWLGRGGPSGYILALIAVGVLVASVVARILSTDPTAISIKRWHAGQLVLFWLGLLLLEWLLFQGTVEVLKADRGSGYDWLVIPLILAVVVAIPIALFSATWVWFSDQKQTD